eukprot:CAMPEP_0178753632 /NCGR_PEP_ID=MMETSP0744-20121128/11713_1 /TAXON_ID=913974 /ORGANISM="Nitzschia punctata, Strain CCMP561" /LENGTH=284 /DNA_ID=CAMNT_0020407457 /DNA_START=113 /DNA_END=967 /DNA_ORIENTATION=+
MAEDNGGRPGYHSPDPTDTYLRDENNPLQRELWRVFETKDGTAYVIPRPDALGLKYGLCDDEDDDSLPFGELSELALEYGLCNETISDPSIINSMDPTDALQLTNYFHRQLIFEVTSDDMVGPFAPDNDILAACATIESPAPETTQYCSAVEDKCNEDGVCIDIAVLPSPVAVKELVPALNALYGVILPSEHAHCDPDQWGSTFGCPVAKCAEPPEGCQYDQAFYVLNDLRDCCAALCYATDSLGNECITSVGDLALMASGGARWRQMGGLFLLVTSMLMGLRL